VFYFFGVKEDRIIDSLFHEFMDIAQRLVGTMSTAFTIRVIVAFVNLKIGPFFIVGSL